MPPTTQQVIDALEAMQDRPIPPGYKSVAKSAANEILRLRAERLKLDRRIHNQRVALRTNWKIIEMREPYNRAWYRSPLLRSMIQNRMIKRPTPWWKFW